MRFADKLAYRGKFILRWRRLPRRHDQMDRRPAVTDRVRQLQAAKRARHLNVGKDGVYVGPAFQNLEGDICITGFQYRKARVFQHLDRAHPNDRLVLDN